MPKKRLRVTTGEAVEQLLGKKAAKRLRQIATQLAADEDKKPKAQNGKKARR